MTSDDPNGERVADGRFVLLDLLGEGGDSTVWRARDTVMHGLVALKLLRSPDPERQRRFATEAALLANLTHQNIVRARMQGVTADGRRYVALELLTGESLQDLLTARGPLPWREVVDLGIQAAAGLAALHAAGVVHRDVKPANLMLTRDAGGAQVVKLIDFGVARLLDEWAPPGEDFPSGPRTAVGMVVGTPGYTPPEAGARAPDERFDVFGLAVALYQLCTGVLPEAGTARPLAEAHPACDAPPDLDRVLAAALTFDPEDRTRSAAELGRALAAVREIHPERSADAPQPGRGADGLIDGRYERLGVIGTGAKGEVLLAVHRGCRHDVALKFLRSSDPDDRRRFEREARILAAFSHPGLPRFFDYAPHLERPYIAMAFAPGQPVVRHCLARDRDRLRPSEVAAVGLQLARVLAFLHERGVIHRDINVNNVIVDLQREPVVKLIDFGCAHLTDRYYVAIAADQRYVTRPENRVEIPDGGIETLAWTAPEARAGRGWTGHSDVYSVGVLLFRLLTGKLPPRDRAVAPRELSRARSEELVSAIVCALQPDPDDRPDAARLATMLEDALESEDEARERALAAAAPLDRPPLRLVGAETSDPHDTSTPRPAPPPAPPPPSSERPLSTAPQPEATPVDPASTPTAPTSAPALAATSVDPASAPAATSVDRASAPTDLASAPAPSTDRAPTPVDRAYAPTELASTPALTRLVQATPSEVPLAGPPPRWRGPLAAVAVIAVIAMIWRWRTEPAGQTATTSPIPGPHPISALDEPPKPAPTTPADAPPQAPADPRLPDMEAALAGVDGALRRCSHQAGGLLFLEFETVGGSDRFAAARSVLDPRPDIVQCVDAALTAVRFTPTSARTFTKEYKP